MDKWNSLPFLGVRMTKSEPVRILKDMQQHLRGIFRERNFRVRGRTYNRTTSDGLTHVVNFQMGRFDPPGTVPVPELRVNYYRKFTVNVGVYVPEVHVFSSGGKEPKFVAEYYCCVRERLGRLGPERVDIWWETQNDTDQVEEVVDEIRQRLEMDGFPFLARFETRDALLKEFLNEAPTANYASPRSRVVCAIVLAARDQRSEARDLLVAHRATHIRERGHPAHLNYLEDLAVKLGLGSLAAT
jgi:hypothetical protein